MIDPYEIGLSVIYAAPVVASLICSLVVGLHWKETTDPDRRRLYIILITFFACIAINWTFILLYIFSPAVYTRFNIICYVTFLINHVVLYHFIYVLTRVPGEKPFPRWHFYIVFTLVAAFGIWSWFVPYEAQYYIVASRGQPAVGYEIYSRFFTLRISLKALYCILYAGLSWILLLRYRHIVVNYSADTGRTSLAWVNLLLALTLTLIFIPLFGIFAGQARAVATYIPGLAMIPILIQIVVLCYYTITGNYVIIENSPERNTKNVIDDTFPLQAPENLSQSERVFARLSEEENNAFRRSFERLMKQHKPYLNPQLRITDIAGMLSSNRTYISTFINRTYGMNFSRYINRLRLKEMELLSRMPEYETSSITELAMTSGFSSYRSYRKFLHTEEARNDRPVLN